MTAAEILKSYLKAVMDDSTARLALARATTDAQAAGTKLISARRDLDNYIAGATEDERVVLFAMMLGTAGLGLKEVD